MAKFPDTCKWRNLRAIGAGGQASVYEVEAKPECASDLPAGKFAMKVLKNTGSAQAVQRFAREVDVLRSLRHPNIAEIVDSSSADASFHYYVMPHYEQGFESLDELALNANSPFVANVTLCLRFIASCADASHFLHQRGIVHRDLNLRNILVNTQNMKPMILDFGCCQFEDGEAITLTDEGVGTKDYMAPECESGLNLTPDGRADVYSLGKILWAIITGKRAFAREHPAFTTRNLRTFLPEASDCWHATTIFEGSIRRDPHDRYLSAEKMSRHCVRLANEVVTRFPPLELVGDRCPACGQGDMRSDIADGKFYVPMHSIFGNPMPTGTTAGRCTYCGFMSAWDLRLRNEKLRARDTME